MFADKNNKKINVMLVDDDQFVLDSLSTLLEILGYKPFNFSDALTALTTMEQSLPDVIITDYKMPQMNGLEFLENVHAKYPELPVIIMTAYAEVDVAIEALKRGAFDFIVKPYKTEQITKALDKAVRYVRYLELEKNYKALLEKTVKERTAELLTALTELKEASVEVVQRLVKAS